MASNMANLLMQYGGQLPGIIKSNRKTATDLETEKLRQALLSGQITESQLGSAFKQKQIDAADLEQQQAQEDAQRKRDAQAAMSSALSSYGSSKRTTGMAQDIAGMEEKAGLTPLATQEGFDKPMTMRESAEGAGLPKFADQPGFKEFYEQNIQFPEATTMRNEQAESRISQKEKELESKEKLAGERIDLQEKLAEARRLAAEASAAAKEGKDTFEKEYKITNQFNALSKDYRTTRDAMQKIEDASKLNNATGDMALIYGFMRMQDPTSTVREGEYATAEQARGIPQSIVAMYNKAIDGRRLSEDQRKQFASTARTQFSMMEKNQKTLEEQYTKIAEDYGLNPERILGRAVRTEPTKTEPVQGTTLTKINLTGDKAKRLEELRRKQAEGTLK